MRERVEVNPTVVDRTVRYTCPACGTTNDHDWAAMYGVIRWEARCARCEQPVKFLVPASDSLGRQLPQLEAEERLHRERD